MALSLGDISIGTEGLYLGDILIGPDSVKQVLPPEILFIEWIVIGAGGGGGFRGTEVDYYRGGSGGGGGVVTGSATLQPSSSLETRVGKGGIGATTYFAETTNGNNSSLQIGETVYLALGGGGGGTGNDVDPGGTMDGKAGGSGGGGASLISSTNTLIHTGGGGNELQFNENGGFGMDGCQGSTNTTTNNSLGGAGGTSVGFSNTGCPFQYTPGFNWNNIAQFSIGGDPTSTSQQSVSFGGFGGNCNSSGSNGEILIRYVGDTAKATGGIIGYSGGYVYHGFVYSGTDPQYVSAFEYNP